MELFYADCIKKLTKLYTEPDFYEPNKLQQAARAVLTKEPKVQSTAIREMREEVKKIIRTTASRGAYFHLLGS